MSDKVFTTLEEFDNILSEKWNNLVSVEKYLNAAGQARKEAFQSILWLCGFMRDLNDLHSSSELKDLLNVSGKHPEYYKTVKMIMRALDKSLSNGD